MSEQAQLGFSFEPEMVGQEIVKKAFDEVTREKPRIDPTACPRCGGKSQISIRPQEMGGTRYCPVCQGEEGCLYFTPGAGCAESAAPREVHAIKPYYDEKGIAIYHGDCREVLPELEDESVDVIWTDPPYGHGNHVDDLNARLNEYRNLEGQPIENDTPELMREVVDAMLVQAARVLKQDCCCCCCCGGGGPRPTFAWVADRMDRNGLQFFHAVVWDKLNPGLGWRYRRQYEMIMIAHRSGGKLSWNSDKQAVPNILACFPERNRLHPNEKPEELVSRFLGLHVPENGLVLDPFMGSGTTLRAAKDLGRRVIGIEIEEKYCEIAAKRLSQEVLEFKL